MDDEAVPAGDERDPDIFDRLMELWQEPWSEPAFGEAQMLLARLRAGVSKPFLWNCPEVRAVLEAARSTLIAVSVLMDPENAPAAHGTWHPAHRAMGEKSVGRVRRKARRDPVTPEVARYVIARDGGCVLATLRVPGRVFGPCRGRITVAHVRDRLGGRTGRRPPSIPRRLVGCCEGHHLDDPLVDRPEVREKLEEYLEAKEGPEPDDARPWETVARVRRPGAMLPTETGSVPEDPVSTSSDRGKEG